MTIRQLPLAESPIRGYMMYAYHLSLTMAHVDVWPWFYTNFVQLQCNPAQLKLDDLLFLSVMPKGEVHFTEGTSPFNPWLANSIQMSDAQLVQHAPDISEYVIDGLSRDYYVETFIDEFHIPQLFNGGNTHFRHRLLVYGFDDSTRTFDIVGFDSKSQYRRLTCTFDELNAAFLGISPQIPDRTKLHKPDPAQIAPAVFDGERFWALLGEYLSGTNTLLNPDLRGDLPEGCELWYGLKVYDFLAEYLVRSIEKKARGEETGIDFRGFHMLWEHKKCMLDRLNWLAGKGFAIGEQTTKAYSRVLSLAEMARSRVVMCRRGLLPLGKGYLDEVPKLLESARTLERELLESVRLAVEAGAPTPAMRAS